MEARPARKATAKHARRNPFRNRLELAWEDRKQASIVVRPIKLCRSRKPQPITATISTVIEHRDIQSHLLRCSKANAERVPLACPCEPMLQHRAKIWPYLASRHRAGLDAHPARKATAKHARRNPFRNRLQHFAEDRKPAMIVVRPIRTRRSWKPQSIASIISTVIEHRDIQNRLRTAEMANNCTTCAAERHTTNLVLRTKIRHSLPRQVRAVLHSAEPARRTTRFNAISPSIVVSGLHLEIGFPTINYGAQQLRQPDPKTFANQCRYQQCSWQDVSNS